MAHRPWMGIANPWASRQALALAHESTWRTGAAASRPIASPAQHACGQGLQALAKTAPAHAPLGPRRAHGTLASGLAPLWAELEDALRDQSAWRAAWSLLRQERDPGDGWAAPLARLQALEQRVAARLGAADPPGATPVIRAAERDPLVALQDLLWGMRDGQLLLSWAASCGPVTPLQLADHFGLHASDAGDSPVAAGAQPLTASERMALSLYSVSDAVHMSRQPVLTRAFHLINVSLRHPRPELAAALQGMVGPLLSGLKRLPPAPLEPVLRGLWLLSPEALATQCDHLVAGARICTDALWTGSREAPYPGQVVFTIHPMADGARTGARDTSAFSYAHVQREVTFVPGTRFEVTSVQLCEPGGKRPPGLNVSDTLAASSGRTWRELRGQPLLAVGLKERPAP
jgi:hypothetical protein